MPYIQKNALTLVILIIVFTGILVRLVGLGTHPFSIDEYYLFKSINLIIEKGLPEFLCGGYYVRGILLQYILTLCILNCRSRASRKTTNSTI